MQTTKAAVLREVNEPLTIEDVQIDDPGPNEILIKTAAAGVCHSDLHFMEGLYRARMPCVPGHESAGVVEAVGSNVTRLAPGDHVITCLSIFCGQCRYCTTGRPALCQSARAGRSRNDTPRLSQDGESIGQLYSLSSYAAKMLIHERGAVKIRDDMPLDRAALIGCAVMTGFGAVTKTADVEIGASVAVIGCGGIGLSAILGADAANAGMIIAIDIVDDKLELARSFGATHVINASDTDPVQAVKELTGGGVDYSFEALGNARTAEQAFEMLAVGGDAIVIGMVPEAEKIQISAAELLFEKSLHGSNMGSNQFMVDMPNLVDRYMSGVLPLDDMISKRVPLEMINEAFADMKAGNVARTVIIFD